MNENEITINGTPLRELGVSLLAGAYAALLTPTTLKDFVENNDPLKDGTEIVVPGDGGSYDKTSPRVKERDVTLTFLIEGAGAEAFLSNYAAFIAQLYKGLVVLHVPALNATYRLLYSSSTRFDNYRLNACKIAVKFREPNPNDRAK